MTPWRPLLLAALVMLPAAASAAPPTPAEEREVMAAMQAWISAVNAQDMPALRAILHDDLIFVHSDGRTQNKSEVLKDVEAGRGAAGVELSETIVRVIDGRTALVKARVHVRGRPRAGPPPPEARSRPPNIIAVVHVLVKGAGGWQLASRQATRPPLAQTP